MSGQTIVLKIIEYSTSKNHSFIEDKPPDKIFLEQCRSYIFYDHNRCTYGIRSGSDFGMSAQKTNSFYCDEINDLIKFLKLAYSGYDHLVIGHNVYNNLPKNSDDITFDILYEKEDSFITCDGYERGLLEINIDKKGDFYDYVYLLSKLYNNYDVDITNVKRNTTKNTKKHFDSDSDSDSDIYSD